MIKLTGNEVSKTFYLILISYFLCINVILIKMKLGIPVTMFLLFFPIYLIILNCTLPFQCGDKA